MGKRHATRKRGPSSRAPRRGHADAAQQASWGSLDRRIADVLGPVEDHQFAGNQPRPERDREEPVIV